MRGHLARLKRFAFHPDAVLAVTSIYFALGLAEFLDVRSGAVMGSLHIGLAFAHWRANR